MTSWHLRIFGWEESGKSPGNERACDGLLHTCEASVIYESVIRVRLFKMYFGPVFARSTEIRLETWGKCHPSR